MSDVKNPKQFVHVSNTLKQLLAHPLFEGDSTGRTGDVDGIPEIVEAARTLIKKLERMWTLKKAIQDLNQKTIAEVSLFISKSAPLISLAQLCSHSILPHYMLWSTLTCSTD